MDVDINSLIPSLLSEYSHGTIMIKSPYSKYYGSCHRKPKMRDGAWSVKINKRWWKIKTAVKIGPSTYLFFVELPIGWWN